MKAYIVNPDTNQLVSIESWAKDADPTRAEHLAVKLENGVTYILPKKSLGRFDWKAANRMAEEYHPAGFQGLKFRLPTRKEFIDLYDARFLGGLDEAIQLVGGDIMGPYWYWTSERDANPNYTSDAWFFSGNNGFAYSGYYFYSGIQAVPVALSIDY